MGDTLIANEYEAAERAAMTDEELAEQLRLLRQGVDRLNRERQTYRLAMYFFCIESLLLSIVVICLAIMLRSLS